MQIKFHLKKKKTEKRKFEGKLKIKLCAKRLYPTESVQYVSL